MSAWSKIPINDQQNFIYSKRILRLVRKATLVLEVPCTPGWGAPFISQEGDFICGPVLPDQNIILATQLHLVECVECIGTYFHTVGTASCHGYLCTWTILPP
jgi:hypothetical protein